MAGKRKRKFCLMKHYMCVQGNNRAQMEAEHLFFQPKPLIYDERKHHETCITWSDRYCESVISLWNPDLFIWKNVNILSLPHNTGLWFGPVQLTCSYKHCVEASDLYFHSFPFFMVCSVAAMWFRSYKIKQFAKIWAGSTEQCQYN